MMNSVRVALRNPSRQLTLLAVSVLLTTGLMIASLLYLAAARTDSVSSERQERLVSHLIEQSAARLASVQESLTLKDTVVRWLRVPPTDEGNLGQMDRNFGTFLHRYYGTDESYIVDGGDRPFYAMRDGQRANPADFERVRAAMLPVVAELRELTRRLPPGEPLPNGSPWVHDIAVVNGHPAILSAKPVISQSGDEPQEPGKEIVQISVMRLDGRFVEGLSGGNLLPGARFSWTDDSREGEASLPFVSRRNERIIGYFIWRPYVPGSIVMGDMMAPLVLAMLFIAAVVFFLLRRIRRSTAELEASEAQATHLAFHDVLTGLPNRALFNDRLDRAIAIAHRYPDRQLALLYLDLDRFKQVNDTLGHAAGDELIREMSRRLSAVVRETDTVARLGGDEFAIIQTDVRSNADIEELCGRILKTVSQPFDLVGSKTYVGMSIGVAKAVENASDRVELTRKADIALYNAKGTGRGRHVFFHDIMDATIQVRRSIERDLRVALEADDQLQVHFQPVYDAASGTVSSIEALARWNHPKIGMVDPSVFIAIAEESGLIKALGEWVLYEACTAAAAWPVERIAVNVSGVQLRDPQFADRVQRILRLSGLDPTQLELEITETAFIENIEVCGDNLIALRQTGVRLALDDFGTGYSSFSHLGSFEVDRVKIDRSFMVGIDSSVRGSPTIQAIVNLAHATGLKITAEGVETENQAQYLRSVGCDDLQGFLLAKPGSLADMDQVFGVDPAVREYRQRRNLAA